MTGTLDEIRSKFGRACYHGDDWRTIRGRYIDEKPYGIRGVSKPDGWYHLELAVLRPPPTELGLIFADMISNLRATLDHIACALVDQRGACDKETYFPVIDYWKDWRSAINGKLKGFPSLWLPEIESVQPFTYGSRFAEHPLHVLHHLDIRTKHRNLLPLVLTRMEGEPTYRLNRVAAEGEGYIDDPPLPGGELTDGATLARIRIISEKDDLRIVGIVDAGSTNVGFGPQTDVTRGLDNIPNMVVFVGSVIDLLAPAFP